MGESEARGRRPDPTESTVRKLFAQQQRCAFPECDEPLVLEDEHGNTSINVEIAHIRPASPDGPRPWGDSDYADDEIRGGQNLLLLCGSHHKLVDDHDDDYTVDRLQDWKADAAGAADEPDEVADDIVAALFTTLTQLSESPTPHTVTQSSTGDHSLNIANIGGDVIFAHTASKHLLGGSRRLDTGAVLGLYGILITVLFAWERTGHTLFLPVLAAIAILGVASIWIARRGSDTRLAFVVVVIAALLAGWPNWWAEPVDTVEVPTVIGLTESNARDDLISHDLSTTTNHLVDDAPAGEVIAQDPEAGDTVDVGTTVELTVSSGSGTVTVPDVVNKEELTAADLFAAADLQFTVKREISSTEKGRVVEQNPVAGSQVDPRSSIEIVVSSGPAPTIPVVPDLTGKTEATAVADLRALGLRAATVLEESTSTAGRVIRQDPAATTEVQPQTIVTIVVAKAPPTPTVTVPGVDGTTRAAAIALVENAGLSVRVSEVASAATDAGRVIRSSPGAGSAVEQGAQVTIVVSSGPASSCSQLNPATRVSVSVGVGFTTGDELPGLVSQDNEGRLIGFEPELITAVLDFMCGYRPEYSTLTTSERFTAVSTGSVDIMMTNSISLAVGGINYTTAYVLVGDDLGEGRAMAVSSTNTTLQADLDATLVELISNGTWRSIHATTLGEPGYGTDQMLSFVMPETDDL